MINHRINRCQTLFMILLVAFLLLKYLLQFLPGITLETLLHYFRHSAAEVGWIGAFYAYAYLLVQIPAGIIVDTHNLPKTVCFALGICLLGAILYTSSQALWALLLSRALMGAGAAFATACYMRGASLFFDRHQFGRLSGLFGTACMGGAGLVIMIFGHLYDHSGFHIVTVTSTVVAGIFLLCALSFLPKRHVINPIRHHEKQISLPLFLKQCQIILNKNNILLLLYNGLAFTPILVFSGLWGKSFFSHHFHISDSASNICINALLQGFALGGLFQFFVPLTRKVQLSVMSYGIAISLILFITLVYYLPVQISAIWIFILCALIGFCASGFLTSYAICNRINSPAMIATAIAVINMGDPIFAGIAEPLMGHIIDLQHGSYQNSMLVFVVYWLLAIICARCINLKKTSPLCS